MSKYDVIVVGCGYAGAVSAERFASIGKSVLVIDKRKEIAGNMFDYKDENGVNVHKYGPHIFHTNRLEVVEYLSKWRLPSILCGLFNNIFINLWNVTCFTFR